MKTMLVVPLLALKLHWLSERKCSVTAGISLLRSTLSRILPAMEKRDIPMWFEQSDFPPLFLYRVMMIASWRSCSFSCSQQHTKSS